MVLCQPEVKATSTWSASYESTPAQSDAPSSLGTTGRGTRTDIRERMENEHSSYTTKGGTSGGSVAADFVHKEGSARGYYASAAPTVRPDGSTSLGTGDDGRIWVDSDTNELYVWSGTAWVVAGRTPPVGTIYIQFAGKTAPATLWGGTWTDVSATYAGCFFRAAGGSASAFASGNQAANLSAHSHTFTTDTTFINHRHEIPSTAGGFGASTGFFRESASVTGVTDYTEYFNPPHNHTGTTNNSGSGTDNRPLNQTIKIWERTA